ncbi:MAG TPA: glycosyltransferase family 4 protein [Thermoanaerobacterales bacterium]|nr:glycosyltransferase family 4 protein [Thermoanaerobacterales bacterium]
MAKRILHTISQYPGKTGSGTYLQAIVKEAHKKGYRQAVIAGISKACDDVEFGKVKDVGFYPVIFETENLPFPIVGMSDVMPYKSTKYSDMSEDMFLKWEKAFKQNIILAIDEFKPDIIIAHHLWLLTSLIKKLTDIPVVSICHGTDLRQLKLANKFKDYVTCGCDDLELVLALNDYQKKEIVENYKISEENIHVVGGGYDQDIFYPSNIQRQEDKIRLIYAGKISFSKGLISLIKAYQKLYKTNKNVEVLLAGSGCGSEENTIRQIIQSTDGNIKLLGQVPHDMLGDLFRKCHIFVLPSFYEGLSLVTLEALASGLSVVSSELPGLKKWLGKEINNSGIIEYVKLPSLIGIDTPNSDDIECFEEGLVSAIVKQIDDLEKNRLQYHKVHEKIKAFSWQRIFEKIESYIINIVS